MKLRLLTALFGLPLLLSMGATFALPTYTKIIIDPNPGNIPVEKLMADLNGDGKLDIIVGLEQAGLYWWGFPSSGKITDPWLKHTIKSTGNFYEDLKPYDLNGDGKRDIIACRDSSMYWYQNPGGDASGVWTEHFIGNGLGHEVELADIDGDGRIDVVTQYGIYFQNTPDSWTYKGLGSLKGLALLDIGSGKGAINLVLNTAQGLTWYENPRETGGNARTGNWIARVIDSSTGSEEQPLAGGFISNDGRMHLLGNPPNQGLVWWQAPADRRAGPWIKHTINSSYQAIHKIVVQDMDRNGTPDLVVGEQEQSHDPAGGPYTFNNDRVAVFYNNGAAGFTEQVLETTGGQNNVAMDVDGDGDIDILNVNHGFYGAPHPIELFVNNLISGGGSPPPPPPPPPPTGGGVLSGTSGASGGFNLTSTGTSDWIHWGRGGTYGNVDRKASGGSQISGATIVGSGANSGGWSDSGRSVSWSDGSPTGSFSNDHGYIWSNGALGTGYQFTAPADGSSRTMIVYFGASTASCTLSAHLSDNSAADYSTIFTGPGAWAATINYHAASAGQSLVLKLLKTGNNPGFTDGSADLDAAMLQGGGSAPPPPPPPPPPGSGNGTGLRGDYFDNPDFTSLKLTRTDPTVNFDWGSGSPDPSLSGDSFSVRWTGQVQAQVSQTYTFYTISDDGVRLWVNGQQIINNWTDHAPTENSGTIALSAGQKYDLKMEFYENGGGAVAKLLWSSPSTPKQAIPQSQLYPASGGGSPPPPPPSSTNLAHNADFESDPNVNYFPYGSGTFSWATDAAHSGTHSLKIVSTQPAGTLTRWLSKTTDIPAQAGTTYQVSAWLKTSGVTDHAVLTINFWNASSAVLSGIDGGTLSGTQNWTQLNVQGTAPAGTAFIRVEFRLWGGGTLWADDVVVTK